MITFKLLWHTKKGFEVRDMENHRVLFLFVEELDVNKVLLGKPWSFDEHLVALKRVERSLEVKSLVFCHTGFWVQVHNLPIGSLNARVARDVVSIAGMVVESNADSDECETSSFMHVRVNINITKQLYRGRKIVLQNREESWVSFKYE